MATNAKMTSREREIIQRLDEEIANMRRKSQKSQEELHNVKFDAEVVDLTSGINSTHFPGFKKPTIH